MTQYLSEEEVDFLKQYAKTIVPLDDYQKRSKDLNTLHYLSGCTTEHAELVDNYKRHHFYDAELKIHGKGGLIEELGDYFWYACRMRTRGIELGIEEGEEMSLRYDESEFLSVQLDEFVKFLRGVFIGTEINSDPAWFLVLSANGQVWNTNLLLHLEFGIFLCKEIFKLDLKEVLQYNLTKLMDKNKGRYRDGVFTAKEAINRDLAAEEETLKKLD